MVKNNFIENKQRLNKNQAGKNFIVIKLIRAIGGCLGIDRRRRTYNLAKSFGEPERGSDPKMSEWGNPVGLIFYHSYPNT